MTDSFWRRSRRLWRRDVGDDVDDEVAFHFQMRVEQFIAAGMSRDDAERAARERFGDVTEVRSELVGIGTRGRRRRDWLDRADGIRQNLIISIRSLRREPLFALGVIITLGLGIGANATMFGVIDRLMLRGPDAVADARSVSRLYITTNEGPRGVRTTSTVGYVTFAALRDRAASFSGVGAYSPGRLSRYGEGADARQIETAFATWELFPMLGTKPALGRFYDRTEDHPPKGENVAVLGFDFWQSEFGGDPTVLGRRILLDDQLYVVIGVAARGFTGPERVRADVWRPISLRAPRPDWPTTYKAQWLRVVARLKPGVSAERASAEVTTILRGAYNGDEAPMRQLVASIGPLWYTNDGRPSQVANVSRWLMGVAVVVLLITCANVANLIVARTRRRRREVAVRLALGAGRGALVRLLLTETMIVALGGAVAALVVAGGGGKLMRATLLSSIVWPESVVDGRLFFFTLALALVVGLAIGLAPALDASRLDLTRSLKTADRDGGGRRGTVRAALSAAQAALSVVLLVGAALFVASLHRIRNVDLGFQPARVIRVTPRFAAGVLPAKDHQTHSAQIYDATLERLKRLPWVDHAAVAVGSPYGYGFSVGLTTPGRDSLPKSSPATLTFHILGGGGASTGVEGPFISAVSNDYFATLGIRRLRGRLFAASDRQGSAPVAIVAETMAKTVWPGEEALGKCLIIGDKRPNAPPLPCSTVVGVVGDVHLNSVQEKATMQYYIPLGQERALGFGGSVFVLRPRGSVPDGMVALRQEMAAMKEFSYVQIETIQSAIDPEFRPWELGAAMFGVFGALALAIAGIGLYSVIAYLVADRTRELGVRVALGATSARIVREVVSRGVATTAVGVAIGTLAAIALARFIQPLLFDVSARSPVVLSSVGLIVLAIAVAASWLPARRASRVDPVIALRAD